MMRKLLPSAIVAPLLASCSPSPIDKAKELASHDLADPSSAQFRDVSVVAANCVAGEINAKNRVGAYSGFRPFVVNLANDKVAIQPDEPFSASDEYAVAMARMDVVRAECGLEAG